MVDRATTKALTQSSRSFIAEFAKGWLWLVGVALFLPASLGAKAAPPEVKKVIYDQDFNGIIGGDADPLVMLLQAPNVQVLGVTKRQKPVPPVDARVADVVWNFDAVKLQAMFLKAMTEPMKDSKQ